MIVMIAVKRGGCALDASQTRNEASAGVLLLAACRRADGGVDVPTGAGKAAHAGRGRCSVCETRRHGIFQLAGARWVLQVFLGGLLARPWLAFLHGSGQAPEVSKRASGLLAVKLARYPARGNLVAQRESRTSAVPPPKSGSLSLLNPPSLARPRSYRN